MNSITLLRAQYVHPEASEENRRSAVETLITDLKEKRFELREFVRQIEDDFNTNDLVTRRLILKLVQAVFERLSLGSSDTDMIVGLLVKSLKDDACFDDIIKLLVEIMPKASATSAVDVCQKFMIAVNVQSQTQPVRYSCYRLLDIMFDYFLDSILPFSEEFARFFLQSCDGEKDPRNLFLIFTITPKFLTNSKLQFTLFAEEIFEVILSAYFPITFRSSPQEISADQLKLLLNNCFAATSVLQSLTLPFLFDKLESASSEVKIDCLVALKCCFHGYYEAALCREFPISWGEAYEYILTLYLGTNDRQVEDHARHALTTYIKVTLCAKDFQSGGMHGKRLLDTANQFISQLRSSWQHPETKQAQLFLQLLSSCLESCENVAEFIARNIIDDILAITCNPTSIYNSEYKLLCEALILILRCKQNIHELHDERIVDTLLRCLRIKTDASLLLYALEGFLLLSSSLSSDQMRSFLNELSDIALEISVPQVHLYVKRVVKELSISRPGDIVTSLMPHIWHAVDHASSKESLAVPLEIISWTSGNKDIIETSLSFLNGKLNESNDTDKMIFLLTIKQIAMAAREHNIKMDFTLIYNYAMKSLDGSNSFFTDLKVVQVVASCLGYIHPIQTPKVNIVEQLQSLLSSNMDGVQKTPVLYFLTYLLDSPSIQCSESNPFSLCSKFGSLDNDLQIELLAQLIAVQVNRGSESLRTEARTKIASLIEQLSGSNDVRVATALLKWTLRGLILLGDQGEEIERLLNAMLDCQDISRKHIFPEIFEVLTLESKDGILSLDHSPCFTRFYGQKLFIQTTSWLIAHFHDCDDTKFDCVRILAYVVNAVDDAVLKNTLPRLLPMLIQSLSYEETQMTTLEILTNMVIQTSALISSHSDTMISKCLMLLKSDQQVRLKALRCLKYLCTLPYHLLHPHKALVINTLQKYLDDPNRDVRREAVACRHHWYVKEATNDIENIAF